MKVLKELLAKRDEAFQELETLTAGLKDETGKERALTEDEEQRSAKLIKKVDKLDVRIQEVTKQEKRDRKLAEARSIVRAEETRGAATPSGDAAVVSEPMTYGEGSENSYYADLVRRSWKNHTGTDGGATERLATYEHQVEREIALRSKFGVRAEREVREINRELGAQARKVVEETRNRGSMSLEQKQEQRAGMTTGGGATASAAGGGGAAFVTPAFYVSDYAPYREYGRAFVDQCNKQPLPDYGMEVYIPQVTGPAETSNQTEGEKVAEKVPAAGYLSNGLITEAGEVIVSQQLLDRAGPNFAFDRLIFDQLNRDYAPKLDTYALKEVLAVATEQSWAGNAGKFVLVEKEASGGFYGQVSKAKAYIRTKEGTVLNPTHLFLDPTRWEYMAAWSDSQGRPVVVPDYAGPFNVVAAGNSDGDVGIEGRTGYRFNGLPVFTDANLPKQGTTERDQAIAGDLQEVYWYEGNPVTRVIPQTYAQNLQTLLQMYAYLTIIVRYPHGIVYVTGTGLSAISYVN